MIFIVKSWDSFCYWPFLSTDTQTLLSPILLCGPSDLVLKKPAILSFQHCAALKQGHWNLSIYFSDSAPDSLTCWQVKLLNSVARVEDSNIWLLHFLGATETGDAWRGNDQHSRLFASRCSPVPLGHRPARSLRLDWRIGWQRRCLKDFASGCFRPTCQSDVWVFAPLLRSRWHYRCPWCKFLFPVIHIHYHPVNISTSISNFNYLIHVWLILSSLQAVMASERRIGGRLVDRPKSFYFQDGGSPLCLGIEELSPGWKTRPGTEFQEILFSQVVFYFFFQILLTVVSSCRRSSYSIDFQAFEPSNWIAVVLNWVVFEFDKWNWRTTTSRLLT